MPYKLRKAPNQDLYWVVTKGTTKKHSKLPLKRENALMQMKALYAAESNKLDGKGIFDSISNEFLNPESHLRKAVGKVTNEFENPDSVLRNKIGDVFHGIRTNFQPSARKTLADYGSWTIVDGMLRRDPIGTLINEALNFITFGEWNKAKELAKYDKLFHLSMVLTLEKDGQKHSIMIEKNEVIYIGDVKSTKSNTETIPIVLPAVTLETFIGKAVTTVGSNFFLYDAFKNNCQDFLISLLEANNATNTDALDFIKQDTEELLKNLPGYTGTFARAITNLAALINTVMEGRGKQCRKCGKGLVFGRPAKVKPAEDISIEDLRPGHGLPSESSVDEYTSDSLREELRQRGRQNQLVFERQLAEAQKKLPVQRRQKVLEAETAKTGRLKYGHPVYGLPTTRTPYPTEESAEVIEVSKPKPKRKPITQDEIHKARMRLNKIDIAHEIGLREGKVGETSGTISGTWNQGYTKPGLNIYPREKKNGSAKMRGGALGPWSQLVITLALMVNMPVLQRRDVIRQIEAITEERLPDAERFERKRAVILQAFPTLDPRLLATLRRITNTNEVVMLSDRIMRVRRGERIEGLNPLRQAQGDIYDGLVNLPVGQVAATCAEGITQGLAGCIGMGKEYAKGKAKVFVLTCIDPRYNYDVTHYLEKDKKLHKDYDLFVLAGASVGATKKEWTKTFFDNLELGIKLHGIKEVWCFDHLDCGMYKATFKLKKDDDPVIHISCMDKLKKQIKKKHPSLEFRKFLVTEHGKVQKLGGNKLKKMAAALTVEGDSGKNMEMRLIHRKTNPAEAAAYEARERAKEQESMPPPPRKNINKKIVFEGSGKGKWSALIRLMGQREKMTPAQIDALIAKNDAIKNIVPSTRFRLKKENVIAAFPRLASDFNLQRATTEKQINTIGTLIYEAMLPKGSYHQLEELGPYRPSLQTGKFKTVRYY